MRILNWLALAFLFLTVSAYAQPDGGMELVIGGDRSDESYVLRYDLSQGENVTYRVVSYDSIVIWDHQPRVLIRERAERVNYRCDTILPDGYGMTVTLMEAVVREKFDSLPWVIRADHPFVGQPIRFLMGPDGERIRLRDTLEFAGSMPGAPFQPLLIPALGGADTVSVGAGSVFERKMWLLDNVYPPVQMQGGAIRKILGTQDTLGHPVVMIELSETGQVWYTPPPPPGSTGENVVTHTRVNGGGRYWIDFEAGYPVAGDYQLIGNITFTNEQTDKERLGRHTIYMEYRIDDGYEDLKDLFELEQ